MPDRMGLILLVENLDQYEAAVKSVKSANDQVESSMTKVEVRSKKADKGLLSLAGAFAVGNVAAMAVVKTVTAVVGSFKNLVVGVTMATAKYKVMTSALGASAEQAGYTKTEVDDLVQAIHEKGVTYTAATGLVLQLLDAEMGLEDALKLVETAQNAASRAGVSTSDTIQRILWALQTNQPYLLQSVYLYADFAGAQEDLAESLDTTTDALTEGQIMQAGMNAVVQAGIPLLGTYEAAMGEGAKVAGSLRDRVKDIKTVVGEITYPAWSAMIIGAYDRAKILLAYLEDNKEELQKMGEALAEGVKLAIVQVDLLIEKVGKIPGVVEGAGVSLAGLIIGFEEAEKRSSKLGEIAGQAFALLAGGVAFVKSAVGSLLGELVKTGEVITHVGAVWYATWSRDPELIRQTIEGFKTAVADLDWGLEDMAETAAKAFEETVLKIGEMTGALEREDDALEDVTRSLEEMIAGLNKVTEATEDQISAAEALADIRLDLQRELVDDLIDQERELLRAQIDLAREREDQARETASAIADAYASAAEDRADLAAEIIEDQEDFERDAAKEWVDLEKDAAGDRADVAQDWADRRIDIEVNTRRRLLEIQRQFDMSLQDAARTRDAFALVQAQRRAATETEDALHGRDEQLTDAQTAQQRQLRDLATNLAEQREDLRQSLVEQKADLQISLQERQQAIEQQLQERLAAIQETILVEEEDRARQLAREREDEALQAQWEQEDRTRRLQQQLQDMEIQYGDLGTITAEGLLEQAQEWAGTYGPDGAVTMIVGDWAAFMETELNRVLADIQAVVDVADRMKDSLLGLTGQPWVIDLYLPPELRLQSPKLGLQIGLENLQKMLTRQPMAPFMAGGFPAPARQTSTRSETYSRSESTHDINMNLPPGKLDLVVQQQMLGILKGVAK